VWQDACLPSWTTLFDIGDFVGYMTEFLWSPEPTGRHKTESICDSFGIDAHRWENLPSLYQCSMKRNNRKWTVELTEPTLVRLLRCSKTTCISTILAIKARHRTAVESSKHLRLISTIVGVVQKMFPKQWTQARSLKKTITSEAEMCQAQHMLTATLEVQKRRVLKRAIAHSDHLLSLEGLERFSKWRVPLPDGIPMSDVVAMKKLLSAAYGSACAVDPRVTALTVSEALTNKHIKRPLEVLKYLEQSNVVFLHDDLVFLL